MGAGSTCGVGFVSMPLLDRIPADKQGHFNLGVYLTLLLSLIFAPLIACGIAVAIGISKEIIWDKLLSRGTPELLDAAATIAGATFVTVILCWPGG